MASRSSGVVESLRSSPGSSPSLNRRTGQVLRAAVRLCLWSAINPIIAKDRCLIDGCLVPGPTILMILRGTLLENGGGDAEAPARAVLAAITRWAAQANKMKPPPRRSAGAVWSSADSSTISTGRCAITEDRHDRWASHPYMRLRSLMREICMSGSVGGRGGQPPRSTRHPCLSRRSLRRASAIAHAGRHRRNRRTCRA
jgi:hypothetical protein